MTSDSNKRDPREGKIVFCEALACNEATVWNSPQWRKTWRSVWVESIGQSLSACSDQCADLISEGRFRVLNERPSKDSSEDKQIKLFE